MISVKLHHHPDGVRENLPRWALVIASTLLLGLMACGDSAAQFEAATKASMGDPTKPEAMPEGAVASTATPKAPPAEGSVHAASPAASPEQLVLKAKRDLGTIDVRDLDAGRQTRIPPLLLTADIANIPLRRVLTELGLKIGAKVYIADSVPDDTVSVKFDELTVAESISRILEGKNYTLTRKKVTSVIPGTKGLTKGEGEEELLVSEIRVLPQGLSARDAAQGSVKMKALNSDEDRAAQTAALAKKALEAEKAEDRLAALDKYIQLADKSKMTAILEAALKDKDPRVRKEAVFGFNASTNPPLEPIAETALQDKDPMVRSTAISTLMNTQGADAIPTLEQALSDPDPAVRKVAQGTLDSAHLLERWLQQNQTAPK